jgi:subtilisin family serine protease
VFAISILFGALVAHSDPARELVVVLQQPVTPSTELSTSWSTAGPRTASDRAGAQIAAELAERLGLVVAARLNGEPRSAGFDPSRVFLLSAADSTAAASAMASLSADPRVAWVEPHARREPAIWWLRSGEPQAGARAMSDPDSFPNDPLFRDGRQWGLENRGGLGLAGADVGARAAWRASVGSSSVVLAFADTGIDPDHPEFRGPLADGSPRLLPGVNVAEGGTDVRDRYGHGTPVSGIAVASTHDGAHFDSLGIAGVCGGDGANGSGVCILPLKITAGASGVTGSFWIAQAILHAVNRGARAVNLSFAGATPSALERVALHEALVHRCVVVAASGNKGARDGSAPQYPAAYAADGLCIQVGASDPNDRRARFSSYGPGLDVLAPGESVWTTFMTYPSDAGGHHPGYVAAAGTSFAAPFVTGAVGLLASIRPELIDTDFQNLLRLSAHDLEAPGHDPRTGAGRLDLAAALDLVSPEIGIWHDEVAATSANAIRTDTLSVIEGGFGAFDQNRMVRPAVLYEVTATVAMPDSFVDSIRVWPRVGGTSTVRGDFVLPHVTPWCEVQSRELDRFTLRGYVYRAIGTGADSMSGEFLPLPLDQARFGFTLIGRVRRPHTHVPRWEPSPVRAWPNPFVERVRFAGIAASKADILDVAGRRVRQIEVGADGNAEWDGRDQNGAKVPAGFYWLTPRARSNRNPALRVLKLR